MKPIGNKKIIIIAISIILVCIIAFICCIPIFNQKQEDTISEQIKSNDKIFIQKALDEFAQNKNIKASTVADKIVKELNSISKNPYNKKIETYTFEKDAKECTSVEYDDNLAMIMISTYDKKGNLSARTVIKPPSFVSYYESDNE